MHVSETASQMRPELPTSPSAPLNLSFQELSAPRRRLKIEEGLHQVTRLVLTSRERDRPEPARRWKELRLATHSPRVAVRWIDCLRQDD